jgi:imidazolonepropionase-like amidohydrolase
MRTYVLITSLLCGALAVSAPTIVEAQTTAVSKNTRVVFYNVDVFDGYRMLRSRTVTIENGMIQSVAAAESRPPAGSSTNIDGHGMTLLSGLIDAHVHIGGSFQALEPATALGVTTVLDIWGDPGELAPLEKEIARGDHPNAADFRTAGTGATVPEGHPTEMGGPSIPTLKPDDDIHSFVDARFAEGSDYLKIMYEHAYPTLSLEQLRALVLAAHKRNRIAVAHESKQFEGMAEMPAGVDCVENIFDETPITREFIETAVASHTVFTPTLSIVQAVGGNPSGSALAADPRFEPYILGWALQILTTKLPPEVAQKHHYEIAKAAVRALHDAGVTILAGTDAPNPDTGYGVSPHQELLLLTECGLSPEEALRAAPRGPQESLD